jgi:hypothetical protein
MTARAISAWPCHKGAPLISAISFSSAFEQVNEDIADERERGADGEERDCSGDVQLPPLVGPGNYRPLDHRHEL